MNELRVICTDCGREFKNMRSGVWVKELFQKNKEVYRVWMADLLGCPECGRVVVARFADNPMAEHWNKEKMAEVLLQCKTRILGKNLFEWKEYVAVPRLTKKREGCPEFLRGKCGSKIKVERVTQGNPEDA